MWLEDISRSYVSSYVQTLIFDTLVGSEILFIEVMCKLEINNFFTCRRFFKILAFDIHVGENMHFWKCI